MTAAMVTAIAALLGSPLAAAAAIYGSRGASRAQREGGALQGYESLTTKLSARLDKAETSEAAAETRALVAESQAHAEAARASAAEARVTVLEAEVDRLRALVGQLGGTL
jgi:uncharacterized protein YceH (UPF0502 family)